ncbi:TPA: hypothetical protein POV64_002728 [Staphylococcus aureus]|nr:hypothetical protein [Staphylococcus aureus]HDI7500412.1 hypothetical protein [Staphylococcus aureus]
MTLFDMPNYLWITTLIMILLTIFCCLVLNKWFVSAVITFMRVLNFAVKIKNNIRQLYAQG